MLSHLPELLPLGLVEGLLKGVLLAASLNRPNDKGQLVVRCLNPSKQPIELKGGTVISTYTGVEAQEVQDQVPPSTQHCPTTPASVPPHVYDLFHPARTNCNSEKQEKHLAQPLNQYASVFCSGEGDVGLTRLVEHSIPVARGTRPIRQPPHRLGPEKEAEAEKQVQDLLQRGLIEPAGVLEASP